MPHMWVYQKVVQYNKISFKDTFTRSDDFEQCLRLTVDGKWIWLKTKIGKRWILYIICKWCSWKKQILYILHLWATVHCASAHVTPQLMPWFWCAEIASIVTSQLQFINNSQTGSYFKSIGLVWTLFGTFVARWSIYTFVRVCIYSKS